MKLWKKMVIGLVLGIGTGLLLGPKSQYLKPFGDAFLALLNMLVILLVFSSLTVGVSSINSASKLSRVGIKTFLLYILTTVVAISIGLLVAKIINPGRGIGLSYDATVDHVNTTSPLGDIFVGLIPSNPIASFANGHTLQIIVFSLFLGIGIHIAGEKAKPLVKVLTALSESMFAMTRIVMFFAPYGVFALMAWVAGTFGVAVLYPLLKLLIAVFLASLLHLILVYMGMLKFLAKLRVFPFFKGMTDAIALAASTTSSSATLPATFHCVEKNLGVSKSISSFVLSLGSTINMNGAAIFQALAAVFIAQAYGIELTVYSLLLIVVTATLSAVGCAGIPGGGLVALSLVLSSVGLPLEGIAIVAGIDRIRDIMGTIMNVLGDAVVAVYIAKTEDELDEKCYNNSVYISFENKPAPVKQKEIIPS